MWSITETLYEASSSPLDNYRRNGYRAKLHFNDKYVCSVRLWSNGSCATSELFAFSGDLPDDGSLLEFLRTQPFKCLDGWKHCIFTLLYTGPADYYPNWGEFLRKHTTIIATFPNYAHGNHSLNLRLLDITKCT